MILTQIITWVYKDFLTLRYPPNIIIWIGMTSLISMSRLCDTIIDPNYWYSGSNHVVLVGNTTQSCNVLTHQTITCFLRANTVLLLELTSTNLAQGENILDYIIRNNFSSIIHWPKPYLLLSATFHEIVSWMMETWMKNHLVSNSNDNTWNI